MNMSCFCQPVTKMINNAFLYSHIGILIMKLELEGPTYLYQPTELHFNKVNILDTLTSL